MSKAWNELTPEQKPERLRENVDDLKSFLESQKRRVDQLEERLAKLEATKRA